MKVHILKTGITFAALLLFTGCIAPVIIHYQNKFYSDRRTAIKIIPIYGDINQIYYYQHNLPFLSELNFDEQYMYYTNYNDSFRSLDNERNRVFYIVISTRF